MQSYTYSVFSIVAIAIHLIFNFDMLRGRGFSTVHGHCYREFLFGVLAYYISDAAWGIFAGLGWIWPWYVDTIFFFLSMVVFIYMWGRLVVFYLHIPKLQGLIIHWCGYVLMALNAVALATNPFTGGFFHFDETGVYHTDYLRDPAFCLLVGYILLIAAFVLLRTRHSRDAVRRRVMMVFLYTIVMAISVVLQVVWPLTPFTALGCLVGGCFFQVFVVQDEKASKHMAELEQALSRARAAEKARSMFFSIVSHDIRTPLNAILGYAELLENGVKSEADKNEALESIRASGTTLLQLVNDVLDLAKMDASKMPLHPQPLSISKLTGEVLSSFRLAASKKGISLVNRTERMPTVLLDSHRFRQILFNLVGNAVKFTPKGSVTVETTFANGLLSLSVADTGIGIASDMIAHILDPFFQVHDPNHVADRAEGTGLGLPICRRLAEIMGGELTVESELGKGSKFTICIPGVQVAEAPQQPEAQPQAVAPEKLPRRVLVVDDSPVNRAVLTAHLKKAGIASIGQACDGGEALSELDSAWKAEKPYEIVLTDFWMPNVNGMELIEKLRNDSRFERLPVYALTADTEVGGDERSKLFTGILLKPITFAKLMEVFAGGARQTA